MSQPATRECRDCGEVRKHNTKNGSCKRCQHFRDRYGISTVSMKEMLVRQNYGCYICGKTIVLEGKGQFAVDHNHRTGAVRAILCFQCNILVGHLESPMREAAEAYLQEFGQ